VREEWVAQVIVVEQATAVGRGIAEERVTVAGPEAIALATAVFKAVPGVEIAALSEAALASTAKAPSPAAAVERPAWEAPEAVVGGAAAAVVGDNVTEPGETT
jgi:hypothetical protein